MISSASAAPRRSECTAAQSPQGILRTAATIQKLQALPALENGQAPVLRYFTVLMETSKLNKVESIELARPALQQNKVALVEKTSGARTDCTRSAHEADVSKPVSSAGTAHVKVPSASAGAPTGAPTGTSPQSSAMPQSGQKPIRPARECVRARPND
jgi:hypothetical protein